MPAGENYSCFRCLNTILFVSTIIFVVDSSLDINRMKGKRDAIVERIAKGTGDALEDERLLFERDYLDRTTACDTQVVEWIAVSFFNYYTFMFLMFYMSAMRAPVVAVLRTRFKCANFFAFVLVPFMLAWNIYGNLLI